MWKEDSLLREVAEFFIVLLVFLAILFWPTPSPAMTGAEWLATQLPPEYRAGHTLPPLSTWGQRMPVEVNIALAERWGYTFDLGTAASGDIATAERWPESAAGKALRAAEAGKYPCQLALSREEPTAAQWPPDTWCRDAAGNLLLINDKPANILSPLAPDAGFAAVGALRAEKLRWFTDRGLQVTTVLNGGEWGLYFPYTGATIWARDPRVKPYLIDPLTTNRFYSESRARQERQISAAVHAALPDATYLYYGLGGTQHRYRYGGWVKYDWDYSYSRFAGASLPSPMAYYNHVNDGWAGAFLYGDSLTQYLASRGHELAYGERLNMPWVCGGWTRSGALANPKEPAISDNARYMGFLKCAYTAGAISATGSYFAYEMEQPVDPAKPPAWLQQRATLAQVHALFSHLEPFLRDGELLPGPNKHRWSTYPAYEFPTGFAHTRVLARKRNARAQWLITAWAADNIPRQVTVTIPDLGPVTVVARPEGACYYAIPGQAPRLLGRNYTVPSRWLKWLDAELDAEL